MDGYKGKTTIINYINNGEKVSYRLDPPSTYMNREKQQSFTSEIKTEFLVDLKDLKPRNIDDEKKWKIDLYKYIVALLGKFVDRNYVQYIINKQNIDLWMSCFTHKTFDPNEGKNYESLEAVGDKILSYTFKTYLYRTYPKITASQLNNIDQQYMSTHYQSMVSEVMGLTNWLRVGGDVPRSSEKIREDLLESFFGCLDTALIRNEKAGLGFGARFCMKFIEKVFDMTINMDVEPAKTYVQQTFQQLGIAKGSGYTFSTNENEVDNTIETQVTIFIEGIQYLINKGVKIPPRQMTFKSKKMTKKPSEEAAFSDTMFFLLNNGINRKWINNIKKERMIDDIGRSTYNAVLAKLGEEYKNITFEETYNSKVAKSVYQIIATKENDEKEIIYTMNYKSSRGENKIDIFKQLINNYLNLYT